MAKDINQKLKEIEIPVMQVATKKNKRATVQAEVPEIAIPKTKAQEYNEAKGRLSQQTRPESSGFKPRERTVKAKARPENVASVPRENAKTATATNPINASNPTAAANAYGEQAATETERRERIERMRKAVDVKHNVIDITSTVPFAWEHPLVDLPTATKTFKRMKKDEKARSESELPALRDN